MTWNLFHCLTGSNNHHPNISTRKKTHASTLRLEDRPLLSPPPQRSSNTKGRFLLLSALIVRGYTNAQPFHLPVGIPQKVCTSELASSHLLSDRNALKQPIVCPFLSLLWQSDHGSYLPTHLISRTYYYHCPLFCLQMSRVCLNLYRRKPLSNPVFLMTKWNHGFLFTIDS